VFLHALSAPGCELEIWPENSSIPDLVMLLPTGQGGPLVFHGLFATC